MSRLPQLPGQRVVRALERADFILVRQKGSHVLLRHRTDFSRRCVVPLHGGKPVKPGTQAILRGAKIGLDEFLSLV